MAQPEPVFAVHGGEATLDKFEAPLVDAKTGAAFTATFFLGEPVLCMSATCGSSQQPTLAAHVPMYRWWRSDNVYFPLEKIASGAFGEVSRAQMHEAADEVALKEIHVPVKNSFWAFRLNCELFAMLHVLGHPNFVQLRDFFWDDDADAAFFVTDLAQCTLRDYIRAHGHAIAPLQGCQMALQIFDALHYLHDAKGLVHCDIKSPNVLLSPSGHVRLADLGETRPLSHCNTSATRDKVVTIWYRAPELLLHAPHFGPPIDVWAAACVLVELLIGDYAFVADDEVGVLMLIFKRVGLPSSGAPLFAEPGITQKLSPTGLALLKALLHLAPERRARAADACKYAAAELVKYWAAI